VNGAAFGDLPGRSTIEMSACALIKILAHVQMEHVECLVNRECGHKVLETWSPKSMMIKRGILGHQGASSTGHL